MIVCLFITILNNKETLIYQVFKEFFFHQKKKKKEIK